MRMFWYSSVIAVLFLALSPDISSQYPPCPPFYTFSGETTSDYFGRSVSSAGDFNNDGYDDLIVGAPHNGAGGFRAGRAYIFSGKDGSTLLEITGSEVDGNLGFSVSVAGNIDGDFYSDVIVGAPWDSTGGRAYVISGQTGSILLTFDADTAGDDFGYFVSSAGKVNADTFDDLIVGAPRRDNLIFNDIGAAYVNSGNGGFNIYTNFGEGANNNYGWSVSSAGNINNDGRDDFIVGAPQYGSSTGRAYVYSGLTGNIIDIVSSTSNAELLGYSVSTAGDFNNDGFGDVIVGAPRNDSIGVISGAAYIYAYDGQSLNLIHSFFGEVLGDRFGQSVALVGDMDNDGYDDVIVGAINNDDGGGAAGKAYVYSGNTGDTISIYVFIGPIIAGCFGGSVSGAGDVNGDGYPDVIVGAPDDCAGAMLDGRAYVYLACGIHGDVNFDGKDANTVDLTYLVDFIFRGGTPPPCDIEADVNGDGTSANIIDLTYLIDFIHRSGPPPPACL